MTSLSTETGYPVLKARLATYYQIVDSSDSMIHEIRRAFANSRTGKVDLTDLPLRHRVHELGKNPITTAQHRALGIGIAAPICFLRRNDDALAMIIEKRSDLVGTYQQAEQTLGKHSREISDSAILGAISLVI